MAQTLIQVKDLKKYYNGGDVKALDGVTVDVYKGDVIAVIGPSGGGKSTFLRSLNLLETPTSGSIIFDGVDITGKKVDLPLHRQKMGMVFQHFNLFPNKTVLDNLTMAPIIPPRQSISLFRNCALYSLTYCLFAKARVSLLPHLRCIYMSLSLRDLSPFLARWISKEAMISNGR